MNNFFDFFSKNTQLKYKPNNFPYVPISGYEFKEFKEKFTTVDKKTFDILYEEFTYGLLKYIPTKYNNCVYSGGSLHDILTNNFISSVRLGITKLPYSICNIVKEYIEEVRDLDIFVYGEYAGNKFRLIHDFITTIHKKYEIRVQVDRSLINVYIKNIPRIIQFVFTNEKSSNDIISKFDFSYLMMYYENKKLWMNELCKQALITKTSVWCKASSFNYGKRIYKTINKGYKISFGYELMLPHHLLFLCERQLKYEDLKNDAERNYYLEARIIDIVDKLEQKDCPLRIVKDNPMGACCSRQACLTQDQLEEKHEEDQLEEEHEEDEIEENFLKRDFNKSLTIKQLFEQTITTEKISNFNLDIIGGYGADVSQNKFNICDYSYYDPSKDVIPSYVKQLGSVKAHFTCTMSGTLFEKCKKHNIKWCHIDNCRDKIYSIDDYNLILTNCRCIDIHVKPMSGYLVATIQLDPDTQAYKYIQLLLNKWKLGCIRINGKLITEENPRVRHLVNSGEIKNDTIEVHMPAHYKIRKNKTYPMLIIKPRMYIGDTFATLYWLRKDTFYGVSEYRDKRLNLDCDRQILKLMKTVNTPKMIKLRKQLYALVRDNEKNENYENYLKN